VTAPSPVWRGVCLFQVCGIAGGIGGVVLAVRLARVHVVPLWWIAALAGAMLFVQTILLLGVKVLLGGRERLVFYHHAALFVLTTTAAATLAGEPLRQCLNAVTPSLFLFLACGRVGCWTAGCCYGRPCRFGFAYGEAHGDAVVEPFSRVPLFPVQLADSVAALGAASLGAALASYEICFGSYAAARFGLEFLRGEPGRRRALGLTEAQWTSAAILAITWPVALLPLAAIALRCRPLPADEIVELAAAIACSRIERTVATTSSGVSVTRKSGVVCVLTPATRSLLRRVEALDRLVCATRNA
jgi:prolipoprotein diacylglyceryltransferase